MGNEFSNLKTRMEKAIKSGTVSHAYIVEGDSLSRKEEFAQWFAKAILCREEPGKGCGRCSICRKVDSGNYAELFIVEKEGNSVKDAQIQNLQGQLMNKPSEEGGRNIAVINDAETMTDWAQNRILKTLEEPYPGTVMILLTGNSDMLIPTIRSRCVRLSLPTGRVLIDDETMSDVKILVDMVRGREIYRDVLDRLEPYGKDKVKASAFLDAMERYMRESMICGSRDAYRNVQYIEEARRDLRYNVKPIRALKNLLIKIGGRNEKGSRS